MLLGAVAADTPAWPAKLSHSIHFSQVHSYSNSPSSSSSSENVVKWLRKNGSRQQHIAVTEIGNWPDEGHSNGASPRWPKQIWNFKFGILLICSCSHNNNNSSYCNCNEQDDDEVDDDRRIEIGYRIGWPRQTGDNFAQHATAICVQPQRSAKISQ